MAADTDKERRLPFSVGPTEVIIVVIIAAMIFGIAKLPYISGTVGRAMWEFTRGQEEAEALSPGSRTEDENRSPRPPDRAG